VQKSETILVYCTFSASPSLGFVILQWIVTKGIEAHYWKVRWTISMPLTYSLSLALP
jgi:hypothetical protein